MREYAVASLGTQAWKTKSSNREFWRQAFEGLRLDLVCKSIVTAAYFRGVN